MADNRFDSIVPPGSEEMDALGNPLPAKPQISQTPTPSGQTVPIPDQNQPAPDKNQLAAKAINQFRAGRDKFGRLTNRDGQDQVKANNSSGDGKGSAKNPQSPRERLNQVRQTTADFAKRTAKTVGKTVMRTFETATAEIWIPILLVITVIFVIIGIVLIFAAFSGIGGKGPPVYPTTDVQKSQAGLAAAFAGDKLATYKTIHAVVASEEDRYKKIDTQAKADPGSRSLAETEADIAQVQSLLKQADAVAKSKDNKKTLELLKQALAEEKTTEGPLPFGDWITSQAKKSLGQPSACFTVKTGATGGRACASFVSVILNQVGVPQSVVATTLEVWQNPQLSVVINRPASLDKSLAKSSVSTLKSGDVVWWGNGQAATYAGALFDHIGIYIGNGQTINNSSSKELIRQTPLDREIIFNGAKRYAP